MQLRERHAVPSWRDVDGRWRLAAQGDPGADEQSGGTTGRVGRLTGGRDEQVRRGRVECQYSVLLSATESLDVSSMSREPAYWASVLIFRP